MAFIDMLETSWSSARSFVGNDMWFFHGLFITVHSSLYFGVSWVVCLAWKRQWWLPYKIQSTKFPSDVQMRQAWLKALFSHALVQPASLALIWPVNTRLGVEHLLGTPFPSFAVAMVQLTLYYFIESTLFYWSHRLLHKSKFLYRTIHKQHHEFIVSTSLCAEYAHPVEAVLTNYIPFLAGPWLWPPHALTYLAWLSLRILQTLDAHSGYQLPFSPWSYIKGAGAAHHDFHHSHPHAGNYGSGIWDSLMGTEKEFRRWQAEQRTKHEETILRKEHDCS